MLRKEDC
jgi:hypothetical protein